MNHHLNYLRKGLQTTFSFIKEHKLLLTLLIILQFLFLLSLGYIIITSQLNIVENAQGIITPLQQANYDPQQLEQGKEFSPELLSVYLHYRSLVRTLFLFAGLMFLLFFILNALIWTLTHQMLSTSQWTIRSQCSGWLKYVVSALVVFFLFFGGSYALIVFLIKRAVAVETVFFIVKLLLYLFLVGYYFLLVAFAFMTTPSWKSFLQMLAFVSLRRFPQTLLVLLITVSLMGVIIYLLSLTIQYEQYFIPMIVLSILFILSLVVTRIFWIASLQELAHEQKNH